MHRSIDQQNYSTAKHFLEGMEVYSEKYNLCGKIDIYDSKKKILIERKRLIKTIYDGYIFQMYGQYFSMLEMGYSIKKIKLYSMKTNKSFFLQLPHEDNEKLKKFTILIDNIKSFNLNHPFNPNPKKCMKCIYNALCDKAAC